MKEMVDWIKATSDIMVRVLLGQEENIPLLKDFINAVLKDRGITPVDTLTLENPITMRTVFNEKEPVLDVKAIDETGRILDVEIQSRNERISSIEAYTIGPDCTPANWKRDMNTIN